MCVCVCGGGGMYTYNVSLVIIITSCFNITILKKRDSRDVKSFFLSLCQHANDSHTKSGRLGEVCSRPRVSLVTWPLNGACWNTFLHRDNDWPESSKLKLPEASADLEPGEAAITREVKVDVAPAARETGAKVTQRHQ